MSDNSIFGSFDFSGYSTDDKITITGGSNSSADTIYTITDMSSTTLTIRDMYQEQIDELNDKFDKIMERLAILDDPSPEQLEKNRSLKKAYEKYKMLEALAGVNNEQD